MGVRKHNEQLRCCPFHGQDVTLELSATNLPGRAASMIDGVHQKAKVEARKRLADEEVATKALTRGSGSGSALSSSSSVSPSATFDPIDLAVFDDAVALSLELSKERLEAELTRLGLRKGGSVVQKAERLMLTKGLNGDLSSLPAKVKAAPGSSVAHPTDKTETLGEQARHPNLTPSYFEEMKYAGGKRKATQGPLYPGLERAPGQKSLPVYHQKRNPFNKKTKSLHDLL
jgi:hypothetical protein